MSDFNISTQERMYLREIAKKQLEYAKLPVMAERERLWRLHNALQGERPMIVMEEATFLGDIMPPLQCENSAAQAIERQLLHNITVHEMIDDDKVVPDFFDVPLKINVKWFGHDPQRTSADQSIGFHIDPVIESAAADFDKLKPSSFSYDQAGTQKHVDLVNETIGDILPAKLKNHINHWCFGITQHIVNLMTMENMFVSMMDEPEDFHRLMRFVTDELHRFLRWQEENRLLLLNHGNDYMGSGSYCFLDGFTDASVSEPVRSTSLWGHLNSQESVGISPSMFQNFMFPYYAEIASEFGLLYYGCCEPVDTIWDDCLSKLDNLRKVSISPWCDEEFMAKQLSGSQIIYSRKPSPNLIGLNHAFDDTAFRSHIQKTANLTRDCKTEFIFRDIYKLSGNTDKVRQAVSITREVTG